MIFDDGSVSKDTFRVIFGITVNLYPPGYRMPVRPQLSEENLLSCVISKLWWHKARTMRGPNRFLAPARFRGVRGATMSRRSATSLPSPVSLIAGNTACRRWPKTDGTRPKYLLFRQEDITPEDFAHSLDAFCLKY